MPSYDPILDTEVDAESPITESLMTRMRDNPEAVASADPTVPSAKRILIPQALRTNEVDTLAQLRPDGIGGVKWTGGGFSGAELDGDGLGSPVASLVAGVYHFEDLTISSAQTPTGPMTIYVSGTLVATESITSSYPIRIFCAGDVTLDAVTCRGLEVRCQGDITLNDTILANSGLTPSAGIQDYDTLGVVRFFCTGDLADNGHAITGDDVLVFCGGAGLLTGTWTSSWAGSGGAAQSSGTAWPNPYGNTNTSAGGGSSTCGGGAGGGTSGGAGGAGDAGVGTAGSRDPYRSGRRPYLLAQDKLRRGSGGGGSTTNTGGKGGGRLSMYFGSSLTATGATMSVAGQNGSTGGGADDSGGGGAGIARVIANGNIAGGTITATGGDGGAANGGGGGGGGAFFAATGYSGSQSTSAAGGSSSQGDDGEGGTTATDTLTTAEIDALVESGIFDV